MLINIQSDQESTTSGVEVAQMQFDTSKQARLFHMLSSSLYSDKPASIIRELCSNCHDSHIMAGKTASPFFLTGPTFEHPYLTVKDCGVGLTADEAVKTILCYLGSNKDTSDDFIGGWGIGSKSPFAYAKNYQVITVKNGMRAEFACWKDEHGLPSQALVDHSPTAEPNGVEIIVPVEPEDVRGFTEAITAYMQWTNYNIFTKVGHSGMELIRRIPVETVSISDDYTIELFEKGTGKIKLVYGGQSYTMEDCVDGRYDYASEWKQLVDASSKEYDIAIVIHKPGSIDFNMNREELEQTEKTRTFVRSVVSYLSVEGNKQSRMYADEVAQWTVEMTARKVDGVDAVPTTLKDVNDMIDKALTRGNNSDRFFGKAFRVFDQRLRYDLRAAVHKITQYSGVLRAHSLNLIIAELHTQFEFVYGRLLSLTQTQRREALRHTRCKEVFYVKAETEAEFLAIMAENPDFKDLDLSKFRCTFTDIAKKVPSPYAKPAKALPPRIYNVVAKAYVAYHDFCTYVMVTAEQLASPDLDTRIIAGANLAPYTIFFVPTPDFKKRKDVPINIMTVDAYKGRYLAAAKKRLKSAAGAVGRRGVKLAELAEKLRCVHGDLPGTLSTQLYRTIEAITDQIEAADQFAETFTATELVEMGDGGRAQQTINKASFLHREAVRVAAAVKYVRVDRIAANIAHDPACRALADSLGITQYYGIGNNT